VPYLQTSSKHWAVVTKSFNCLLVTSLEIPVANAQFSVALNWSPFWAMNCIVTS